MRAFGSGAVVAAIAALISLSSTPAVAGGGYYGAPYGWHGGHYGGRYAHKHYGGHGGLDGDAIAVVAGLLVGAVVLDAIFDDRKDARRAPLYHPAPPPTGFSTSYRQDPAYAAPGGFRPSPWERASGLQPVPGDTASSAVDVCAAQVNRMLAREGVVNSYVRNVDTAERSDNGVWRVEMNVIAEWRNAASVRPVVCEAEAGGVRAVRMS